MKAVIEQVKQYLGYTYYNIGYGRDGRIPRAMCRKSAQLHNTILTLNQEKKYNTYLRVNADFKCRNPCSITDGDIDKPEIYLLDIDRKDNPTVEIERAVREFLLKHSITNYLFAFTGHGYQLWLRCKPVSDTAEFKQYAGWIRNFIENDRGLIVDFTPNPSRYARFPGSVNYNPPRARGRIIEVKTGSELKPQQLHHPPTPSEDQPNPTKYHQAAQNLRFIRNWDKRQEIAQILYASNPQHKERVYLVGFLCYCELSAEEIMDLINAENSWEDYDRNMTEKQVRSILRNRRKT